MSLNISPETLIGDKHALRESEYSESDCVWGYYDKRPVKHLDDDETYSDYTDGSYKMVYDPDSNSKKWSCDEGDGVEYSKLYFLDHQTERGFLTECVGYWDGHLKTARFDCLIGDWRKQSHSLGDR